MTRWIGISGAAGVGKDTVAKMVGRHISDRGGTFRIMPLASPIKDFAATMFGWNRMRLEDDQEYKNGNKLAGGSIDPVCEHFDMSRREIMQRIGTDAIRNGLHEDAWLVALDTNAHRNVGLGYVIVPDVRFENELRFIRRNGGTLIRVDGQSHYMPESAHISEREWRDWKEWDTVIVNPRDPREDDEENLRKLQTLVWNTMPEIDPRHYAQ